MNRDKALKMDQKGSFYCDEDPDTNCWAVFGSESGFCYYVFYNESEAQTAAAKLERSKKK